jgi:hypothetical protein
MGIVKGFTDILAPQNLATNGSFRINQRENFTSLSEAKTNDYITDCFFLSAVSVDTLSALNSTELGRIRFSGYGKRGQSFNLRNRDYGKSLAPYFYNSPSGKHTITGAVNVEAVGNTIPFKVVCTPRGNNAITLYSKPAIMSSNQKTSDRAIDVRSVTEQDTIAGNLYVELLADGYFSLYLYNYMELAGSYINPPNEVYTNYADDLLRCKRYYQTAIIRRAMFPLANIAITPTTTISGRFDTQMAGTPTITLYNPTASYVQLEDLSSGDRTLDDGLNWSYTPAISNSTGFSITATRNAPVTGRTCGSFGYQFDAAV